MIELITSVIISIIFPLILFILKKLYYINHVVTEIRVELEYIKKEIEELKNYIYKRL